MSNFVNTVEFAKIIGKSKQYVSKIKKEDKLILNEDGLINVEESKKKLLKLSDPAKKNNGNNAISNKVKEEVKLVKEVPEENLNDDNNDSEYDYNLAKSKKEHYLAEKEKIRYMRECEQLAEVSVIENQFAEVGSEMKSRLLNLKNTITSQLLNLNLINEKDFNTIQKIIDHDVYSLLNDFVDNLKIRIKEELEDDENEEEA